MSSRTRRRGPVPATSTTRQKWLTGRDLVLLLEGPGGVEPLDGFGHGAVEVVDEGQNPVLEILPRGEAGSAEELAHQDAEPNLDLVEPGAVLGGVHEADAVARRRQEGRPAGLGLQHPAFPLLPQVVGQPARGRHVAYQAL